MPGRYVIELEPEVRDWLETLTLTEYAKVEAMADILADNAETLGEPTRAACSARPANFASNSAGRPFGSATGSRPEHELSC